ncbi:MAG: DM13 domain-containing protein [Nodosilinea sp.]
MAAEQPTVGTARIVQEAGRYYVELDSAFQTSSQGPDLHVLLDKATQAPASYGAQNQTVNLGRLQTYSGAQRYAIPANVDVSQYHTVVIWCQMANATFGYAPLNSAV